MVSVFFINLLREKRRRYDNYDDSMTLVKATTRDQVSEDVKTKMVSYHNISPSNHLGKCACFLSHYQLLKDISNSNHKGCVILEDDAVGQLDYDVLKTLPKDGLTYLGGFFAPKKITETGKEEEVEGEEVYPSLHGLNELGDDRKLLMTLSYYIPTPQVAKEIVDYIDSKERLRAIDVMLNNWEGKKYYWFPALYKEGDYQSGIREKKTKHSTLDYNWV